MDSEKKDLEKAFTRVSDTLYDLSMMCDSLFDDKDVLETEIGNLRYALEQAQEYYTAARNELTFILGLCLENGMKLPVEEHFMDINDLVPETDPQRGQYEGVWLDESFTYV